MEEEITEVLVREILAESLYVDLDKVVLDANIVDGLGADSLDFIEALMNIEQEFDIEISDEEAENIVIVSDLIDVVKSKEVS